MARSKYFCSLLYPDSLPSDWMDIISSFHIPYLISPLHDKDVLDDGTLKKPHYHFMLFFDSLKSLNQVNEMIAPLNGTICKYVSSVNAYGRYLCHLDNPEKYQYPISEVTSYMVDYGKIIDSRDASYNFVYKAMQMIDVIPNCTFTKLLNYAHDSDFDVFKAIVDRPYLFHMLLSDYFSSSSDSSSLPRSGGM